MAKIEATHKNEVSAPRELNGKVTIYNLYDCPLPLKAWESVINAHVEVITNNKWGIK